MRRRLGLLFAILLCVGGCGSVEAMSGLINKLQGSGYERVSVNHNTNNGFDRLAVSANTKDQKATTENLNEIAKVVWETYPLPVDELTVSLNGNPARAINRDGMERQFGPRKAELDQGSTGVGAFLIGLGIFFLLVVIAIVVIIVIVIKRSRKRRAQQQQYPYPYPPGQQPYPPQFNQYAPPPPPPGQDPNYRP